MPGEFERHCSLQPVKRLRCVYIILVIYLEIKYVCVYCIRIKIKKKKKNTILLGDISHRFPNIWSTEIRSIKNKKIIITIILLLLYGLCKKLRGRSATERCPGETPFLLNDIITYYNVMSATV